MPLNANNKKNSCRDHYSGGLGAGQACTVWNDLKCPSGGALNAVCSGGHNKCWSQNQYFGSAAYCHGLDDVYYDGSALTPINKGACPAGSVIADLGGEGRCRKLVPNAFEDYSGATIQNHKSWKLPTWSSGPVPTGGGSSVMLCAGAQVATGTGADLGCKALRPTQETFMERASKDHW